MLNRLTMVKKLFFLITVYAVTTSGMETEKFPQFFDLMPADIIAQILIPIALWEDSNINPGTEKDSAGQRQYLDKVFFDDEFSPFEHKKIEIDFLHRTTIHFKSKFGKYDSSQIIVKRDIGYSKGELTATFMAEHCDVPKIVRSPLGIKQIIAIRKIGFVNARLRGVIDQLLYGAGSESFIRSIVTALAEKLLSIENKNRINNFENTKEMLQVYVAAQIDETDACIHLKHFWQLFVKSCAHDAMRSDIAKNYIFGRGRYGFKQRKPKGYTEDSSNFSTMFYPKKIKDTIAQLQTCRNEMVEKNIGGKHYFIDK